MTRIMLIIALIFPLTLAGCANPQALGERYVQAAQGADDAIGVINDLLAEFPEGSGTDADLLPVVRDRLPLDWRDDFDWAYQRLGDARESLIVVRDEVLTTFRDEAQVRAREAFAQAEKQADDFDNIVWSLGEIAAWVGGPTAAGLIGVLGLALRRERGRTEDIVTSINDSPSVRDAVKNAGDVIQNADTQKRVAAILRSVGGAS